jgi:hypothetical protein
MLNVPPTEIQGGSISLLDSNGLKISGVAYTGEQASREGWTVVF